MTTDVLLFTVLTLLSRAKRGLCRTNRQGMRRDDFQLREEIADQIRALNDMKEMAESYGYDISQPAKNAEKQFSGSTSDTLQLSRLRTALQ